MISSTGWQRPLIFCGSLVLVVASFYWARGILIPVVLAILLTFVLSPFVSAWEKLRLGRVPAAILVVFLAVALFAGLGCTVFLQIKNLATDLQEYKDEIADKIVSLRDAGQDSWVDSVLATIQEIWNKVHPADPATEPMAVKVESSGLSFLGLAAISTLDFLVNTSLVIVLVAFMLIQREDLRNRLIRLWGNGNLTSMTKALDDATRRISSFLLMQLIINSVFGLILGIGLFLLGIPYAFFWGLLGAVLRYIPYLGAWLAAIFPIALSFVLADWYPLVLVISLFVVLELVISNVVEPRLYGHSIGVSAVALLIAAAFWAWLWGPIGLILSTPLTACLAVLGRYVPHLEVLSILLGDEPVLQPHILYYQRLLARDQDEACDFIEEYLQTQPVETVYDKVLIPALIQAERTQLRGELTAGDSDFILQITREVVNEIVPPPALVPGDDEDHRPGNQVLVFGCPARDEADELALSMFGQMLDAGKCRFEIFSPKILTAEILFRVKEEAPSLLCIGTLPVRRLAHTRYLCKRLRAQFPDLKILVGCWGLTVNTEKIRASLLEAGADHVGLTVVESLNQIVPLLQVLHYAQEPNELAAANS